LAVPGRIIVVDLTVKFVFFVMFCIYQGKGRGLAGRVNLVEFKGNTNTSVVEKTAPKVVKKAVVTGPLGAQKFGTQATKAPVITLYRNGDKHHKGEVYTVKLVKTMEQFYDKASNLVKLPTGAVRKVYKQPGKVSVKSLDELVDGGKYLCCGGEKPAAADLLPTDFLEGSA
jgi:hypothetical protein